MGWLGWVPDAALGADVNLVVMALASKRDLISIIYGDGKRSGKKKKVTAAEFKALVAAHNRALDRGASSDG